METTAARILEAIKTLRYTEELAQTLDHALAHPEHSYVRSPRSPDANRYAILRQIELNNNVMENTHLFISKHITTVGA